MAEAWQAFHAHRERALPNDGCEQLRDADAHPCVQTKRGAVCSLKALDPELVIQRPPYFGRIEKQQAPDPNKRDVAFGLEFFEVSQARSFLRVGPDRGHTPGGTM